MVTFRHMLAVAASEALGGLYLESYQDDASSATADMCLQLLETIRLEIGGGGSDVLGARAKALKGLVELIHGNVESGEKCSGFLCFMCYPLF
ncbi:hypothetical protein RND71_031252 [Anisodus tanguticus]|uniref:Uncharacterized protein n=1 Tax=Anisodus tanguticus TaxID=243964 RepID=A0AAE1RDA0_9SOLA|nr:hypothetical protein RND71_031252 [Anisodus tanguticus]